MKKLIYMAAALALLCSCNEDPGNYDYTDINTVQVRMPAEHAVKIANVTVTLKPELSQSLEQNKTNLEFEWLYSTLNENFYGHEDYEIVGHGETIDFEVTEDIKVYDHFFRLNVHDKTTGITYPVVTKIKLVKPYTSAWMVLHEEEGAARLGAVEYLGKDNILVTPDVYFQETGKQFTGKPVCLFGIDGMYYYAYGTSSDWSVFGVFTDDTSESGIFCQWEKMRQVQPYSDLVAPIYRSEFDYSNLRFTPGYGGDWGFCLISGGVLYQCNRGMKLYKVHVSPDLGGAMNITHATKFGFRSLAYDEAGKRFIHYSSQAIRTPNYRHLVFDYEADNPATVMMTTIPVREGLNVTGADPNKIDPEQKVLYVGKGYKYEYNRNDRTEAYALAKKGAKSYVYEFRSGGFTALDLASFTGYNEINTPEGLDENSCFASSELFSGIMFYASGNKVYRLDFKQAGGNASVIYTHEGGGTVTMMKFAQSQEFKTDHSAYEFEPQRSLGVAFTMPDGTGEVAIINLSGAGRLGEDSESYPAVQVHKGFGPITDIVFI